MLRLKLIHVVYFLPAAGCKRTSKADLIKMDIIAEVSLK